MKNVAGSGAKWLDVSAERFPGWISSFARRHGEPEALGVTVAPGGAAFTAQDGALAECHPPFGESFFPLSANAGPGEVAELIAVHARAPRAVGVLLVRLGGYAAGVFVGYPPALADAKTGSRLVHGRSAAGGWSQHRFARRREKQASEALDAAAAAALAVFGRWESGITASSAAAPGHGGTGHGGTGSGRVASSARDGGKGRDGAGRAGRQLDAVVLGGDKRAMAELRDDPRLARYLALATERFITVPDPKRAVLESSPKLFTAVRIRLTEPDGR